MNREPRPRPVEDASGHVPVLPAEVMRLLDPAPGQVAVDLTAGRGGHALLLAQAVGARGEVVLVDADPENLRYAQERVAPAGSRVRALHASFAQIEPLMLHEGLRADAVLADLGFSSTQMDDPARGFSFLREGPLDMRMNPTAGEDGARLLERLSESELADAIFHLGQDPLARRIAHVIVERRRTHGPIRTTHELAQAVMAAYGPRARHSRLHPATRTFMALRILVNDELGALERLLAAVEQGARAAGSGWLASGARVAIITFHSLEDRMVKQAFSRLEQEGLARRLTRKPVTAGEAELAANSRARSAKLRAVQLT